MASFAPVAEPYPQAMMAIMRWLAIALFVFAAQAQTLQQKLKARIADFPGTVSLYAKNLDTGATIDIRGTQPVRTASTIKLPILCAVFDAVAHDRAKWTELLTVSKAEKVSGSGVIGSELSDGVQLPLRDVVHLMIVLSDNTATNMIIERFGADMVNAYLDRIGIPATRAMRKILGAGSPGLSAAGKLPENERFGLGRSTPRDMVAILEKLDRGEIVDPESSKEILAIMKRCQDVNGIRRHLGDLKVANKTGALDNFRADVGIVYTKTGRIAMAIYVDGMTKVDWSPDNAGSLLIAELSQQLVEGLAKP
jgi:beta-lactamase class A